eukprot:2723912-Prymnesium_polylepis.1
MTPKSSATIATTWPPPPGCCVTPCGRGVAAPSTAGAWEATPAAASCAGCPPDCPPLFLPALPMIRVLRGSFVRVLRLGSSTSMHTWASPQARRRACSPRLLALMADGRCCRQR